MSVLHATDLSVTLHRLLYYQRAAPGRLAVAIVSTEPVNVPDRMTGAHGPNWFSPQCVSLSQLESIHVWDHHRDKQFPYYWPLLDDLEFARRAQLSKLLGDIIPGEPMATDAGRQAMLSRLQGGSWAEHVEGTGVWRLTNAGAANSSIGQTLMNTRA